MIPTTAYIQTDNFDLPKNGSSQKLFPFSLYITNKKDDTEVPSLLVEVTRFELATPSSRTMCATKLRYTSI